MHKTEVETKSTVRGIVTVETTENNRDVDICIREATNCTVTGEAAIRLSPIAFYDLAVPILEAMGCTVHTPSGGL